jgi:hypothetical protein
MTIRYNQKQWLEICAIFFRDGVEEMMRNTSCFIIVLHVHDELQVPKEANKSNPPLV